MTGLEKMIQIMEVMMNSMCSFLKLTMESCLDFNGVFPTLDLIIWVRMEDNKTMNSFYSKPMANSKELNIEERIRVVDEYAMKVVNSGYGLKQTRNIIVGGLTGYERKMKLSLDVANPKWKPLH